MNFINTKKNIKKYLILNKNKIKINSKDITKNDVFLSLQGLKTHGNFYINDAIKKRAKYIITDNNKNLPQNSKNILVVKNSINFISKIAFEKRKIYKGKVIGITGSVGKTTVKEYLKFFLSFSKKVFASIKSYNNYLGVLISLTNLDLKSNFAIFEIGTSNYNEIKKLTKIIKPEQTIITSIHPTHLLNFKNTRNVAVEKSDIFNSKINDNLKLTILPNSNKDELFLVKKANKNKQLKVFTFGDKINSDFRIIENIKIKGRFSKVKLTFQKNLFQLKINSSQKSQIFNVIIVMIIFNYNNIGLKRFFEKTKFLPKIEGRGAEKVIKINKKKITIIDESYNASPTTMKNAINYFDNMINIENKKKFIILGDMNELGSLSNKYHRQLIKQLIKTKIKKIILSGKYFKLGLNYLNLKSKKIKYFEDEFEIIKYLKKELHNNDTILIKCSNSTKINNLAKILLNSGKV